MNNTLLRACTWAWCAVAAPLGLAAQDLHFGHLTAVPTQVNPAYAGLLEGKARAGVATRGQWNSVTNAFRTAALSADMQVWDNGHDIAGAGIYLNSDRAGDLDFTTQEVGLTGSYLKALDDRTFVGFGLVNQFTFRRIDWTQARGFDFEPEQSLASDGRVRYWSLGAGLAAFRRINRKISWFVGGSAAHLNRPTTSFLADADNNVADQVYTRWALHGGAEIKFGRFNSVRPSILAQWQGPSSLVKVGSFYRFRQDMGTHTDAPIAVHFGVFGRFDVGAGYKTFDAVILAARFDYERTVITASFDTNVSSLAEASRGVGGPELSVVQQFDWGGRGRRRSKVKCPTFQY